MKFTDLGDKGPEFKLQSVAEGPAFDKWADDRAASQLHKLKKPHPETWHDVDKKLGKAVDKMSQAEKVKKGLAHPDTLKKQGMAEGFKNTYNVGDRVDGPLGTGTIVAVSPNINVDGKIKVKLDDPSRAGEDGKERDTFVLNTIQVKHITDEASLAQMRDYFNQADTDSVKVDRNYDAPSKKQNPLGVPPEIQALVNKMYHAGKISPQEFEVLRKFQQKTKINVGIREADKNPYAIGMAQAMKSTGDKPPLKKSTINKAHEIARAIKKGD